MEIIGIGHKARRGKDSVAQVLIDEFGFQRRAFASALYDECHQAYIRVTPFHHITELPTLQIDLVNSSFVQSGDKDDPPELFRIAEEWIKRKGVHLGNRPGCLSYWSYECMMDKDAELLQWYGTEFRRNLFGQDYWLKQLDAWIEEKQPEKLVVPDVRFPNEVEFIKERGGQVWKVGGQAQTETGRPDDHPSETALDDYEGWDDIIANIHTLDTLKILARGAYNRTKVAA